jgi:hypothetical protein
MGPLSLFLETLLMSLQGNKLSETTCFTKNIVEAAKKRA